MEGLVKAQLKDRILKKLLDIKTGWEVWTIENLFSELGNPTKSQNHLLEVLKEMVEESPRHIKFSQVKPSAYWQATVFTQEFIDAGGFVNQYESNLEADREAEKLVLQDKRKSDLQEENLALSNQLNRQRLKTHWIPILVSLLSLAIAAYSLFKPSNNVTQERYDTD